MARLDAVRFILCLLASDCWHFLLKVTQLVIIHSHSDFNSNTTFYLDFLERPCRSGDRRRRDESTRKSRVSELQRSSAGHTPNSSRESDGESVGSVDQLDDLQRKRMELISQLKGLESESPELAATTGNADPQPTSTRSGSGDWESSSNPSIVLPSSRSTVTAKKKRSESQESHPSQVYQARQVLLWSNV